MSDTTISSTPTVTPPGKKPLLRRRWVKVTGAITGGSLIAVVAFAVGHAGGTPAAATTPAKPVATTPAKPAAPPTSPAPARPQTLLQSSGSGNYTTAKFTVGGSGDYDVYWTYKPSADFASQDLSANFSVQADNGNDMQFNDPNQLGKGGSGMVHVYGDAGTHYLTITGEADWTITVTAMSGRPAALQGSAQPAQSTQPVQATQGIGAKAVVDQFYQDLNARDYQAAWQLGGSNVSGGVGYSAWVAGYATTANVSASTVQDNDGTVSVNITAKQTDGSVKTYAGTDTVANGVIVAAHITQTGGPAA